MPSIGEQLRSARLARNLQLEELAARTKIRAGLLGGLEEDNYGSFPNDFYVIGFARQYARELGLDEDRIVAVLRAKLLQESETPVPIKKQHYSFAQRSLLRSALSKVGNAFIHNARQSVTTLAAVALIGVGSYAWYCASWNDHPGSTSRLGPVSSVQDATSGVAVVDDASQEIVDTVAKDVGSPAGAAGSRMEITIQASDRVWVRSLADGVTERETILLAGERQRFQANSLVQLTIGSAGAATLTLNGETIGTLGSTGQVRHLRITRDGWSFTKTAEF